MILNVFNGLESIKFYLFFLAKIWVFNMVIYWTYGFYVCHIITKGVSNFNLYLLTEFDLRCVFFVDHNIYVFYG